MNATSEREILLTSLELQYYPGDQRMGVILACFLGLVFFGLSVLIFVSNGPSPFAFGFPVAVIVLFALSTVALKQMRGKLIGAFDRDAVVLRSGRRLSWGALQGVEYRTLQRANRKWVRRIDLVFGDSRVFVGRRIKNFEQALDLVRQLPVEQRDRPLS